MPPLTSFISIDCRDCSFPAWYTEFKCLLAVAASFVHFTFWYTENRTVDSASWGDPSQLLKELKVVKIARHTPSSLWTESNGNEACYTSQPLLNLLRVPSRLSHKHVVIEREYAQPPQEPTSKANVGRIQFEMIPKANDLSAIKYQSTTFLPHIAWQPTRHQHGFLICQRIFPTFSGDC